jgi:hypothetical protein
MDICGLHILHHFGGKSRIITKLVTGNDVISAGFEGLTAVVIF